jgi:hypothetical protein
MIPCDLSSPYAECIFDVQSKILAVIGKDKKESLHMLPKLNDQGDVQYLKIGKRNNGKDYAEERKTIESFYEYYVEDIQEIKDFVSMFAVNADTFDIQKYIDLQVNTQPVPVEGGNLITTV